MARNNYNTINFNMYMYNRVATEHMYCVQQHRLRKIQYATISLGPKTFKLDNAGNIICFSCILLDVAKFVT